MRQFAFVASSLLAITGSAASVIGIMSESFKMVAIGIILILTAGVFATLTVGIRAKM